MYPAHTSMAAIYFCGMAQLSAQENTEGLHHFDFLSLPGSHVLPTGKVLSVPCLS